MRLARIGIVATVVAVALAGCGLEDPDGEGAEVVQEEPAEVPGDGSSTEPSEDVQESTAGSDEGSQTETEETSEDEAAMGTRQNPLPLGTVAKLGDYEVVVTEVVLDATQQNLDDNQFNEEPPEGTQWALVSLSGKYVGEESGDPGWDLSWKMLGADNNTFDSTWEPDNMPSDSYFSCTLDTMYEIGETFPGGEWTGDFCLMMPKDQVEGSSVILENTFSMDGDRTFWATQ